MTKQFTRQHSYLLRFWPVQVQGQVVWRANLTHIPDGDVLGFADLTKLFEYLEVELRKLRTDTHPDELETEDLKN